MGKFDVERMLAEAKEADEEFGEDTQAPGTGSRPKSKGRHSPERGHWVFTPNPPPEEVALQGLAFKRRMGAMGINGRVDKL